MGLSDSRGAHDESHAGGDLELAQRLAQRRAILSLDAAGDSARSRIVGHENEVAPGQTRKRRERRPLSAALLLFHLDQEFLPLRKRILHGRGLARFGGPVGIELARDLLEGQEAVAFGSVVDERGLQTGLEPRDPGLVQARLALAARGYLDVEVVEKLTVHHGNPTLLGLGGVDQHSFHFSFRAYAAASPR